jgi:hypothetical protein
MVAAPVGESVHQPRVAVEGKDDRPVLGEQGVELPVGQPVGMLGVGQQAHEVDHVDDPDPELGQLGAQDRGGRQGLQGQDVTGAGEHHIGEGVGPALRAGPLPDPGPAGAVQGRVRHRQPVLLGLLAGDHDVDVVPRAQAVFKG